MKNWNDSFIEKSSQGYTYFIWLSFISGQNIICASSTDFYLLVIMIETH